MSAALVGWRLKPRLEALRALPLRALYAHFSLRSRVSRSAAKSAFAD